MANLVLVNVPIDSQRIVKAILSEKAPSCSLQAGIEHSAHNNPWIEFILKEKEVIEWAKNFLGLIAGDVRSGLVGFLVSAVVTKLATSRQSPSTLDSIVSTVHPGRVRISIMTESEVLVSMSIEAAKSDKLPDYVIGLYQLESTARQLGVWPQKARRIEVVLSNDEILLRFEEDHATKSVTITSEMAHQVAEIRKDSPEE